MGALVGIALIWFIIEMLIWYLAAQFVSGWYVFFWFVIAFFIGLNLVRANATGLMPQMQQMQMGQIGADPALSNNLPKIFAGFLLMIPGLISDVLALLVMIPAVQNAFKASVERLSKANLGAKRLEEAKSYLNICPTCKKNATVASFTSGKEMVIE